jgi:hypothetical protein
MNTDGAWGKHYKPVVGPEHPDYLAPVPDNESIIRGCRCMGPMGFLCTLALEHPGDHAAHVTGDNMIARWPR